MLDGTCEIKYNLTHISIEVKGESSEKMFFPMGVRLHSSIFAHRFFRSDYQRAGVFEVSRTNIGKNVFSERVFSGTDVPIGLELLEP